MDDDETKTALGALETKIDGVQTRLMQRLDEMAARLEEGYRDTRMELLRAIYTLGQTIQSRIG